MRRALLSAWTSLILFCASCGGIGDPVDLNHCMTTYCVGGEATAAIGLPPLYAADILVVIDDSVPWGPYATNLEQGLREMLVNMRSPVDSSWDGIDLNVALVPATMEVESPGAAPPSRLWPSTPYCALPSGMFLHSARLCDAPSNFQGDLADAVACAALHLPASGQSPRPVETIRALLEPGGLAETSGFHRKSAYLLLVIVSTQDEPTIADAETLAAYHDFLGTVVDDPEQALLAGVVAPATALGLSALAKSFGGNGAFSDITAESWSAIPFVTDYRLVRESSPLCIDWPVVDVDANTPGIQPDCVATEIHLSSTLRSEEILARCPEDGSSPGRCWKTSSNPGRCPANEFEFVVSRPALACLPSYYTKYTFTCATRLE